MDRVFCKVLFFEGRWRRKLSEKSIELALRRAVSSHCWVVSLEFVKPDEDVAFEAQVIVDVDTDWGDREVVRDEIIEWVLSRFEPEFESMIDVEVEDAR